MHAHAGTISDPIGSALPLSPASSAAPTPAKVRTPTASPPEPPAIDDPRVGTVDTTADAQADPNLGGYDWMSESTASRQYNRVGGTTVYYDKGSATSYERYVACHRVKLAGDEQFTVLKKSFSVSKHRKYWAEKRAHEALAAMVANPEAFAPKRRRIAAADATMPASKRVPEISARQRPPIPVGPSRRVPIFGRSQPELLMGYLPILLPYMGSNNKNNNITV